MDPEPQEAYKKFYFYTIANIIAITFFVLLYFGIKSLGQ